MNDTFFLLRKEKIGMVAIAFWALGFLFLRIVPISAILLSLGWFFTAYWIGIDASYRKLSSFGWVMLWILTGPLALLVYFLSRPPFPWVCYSCGSSLTDPKQICPVCGYQSYFGRIEQSIRRVGLGLSDSLVNGPVEGIRHTAKYMAFALGGSLLFLMLLLMNERLRQVGTPMVILINLVFAAYWICTAWWVYLDAKWRRMDAIPWAVLTLVTNLFGLVTYLVIRYPDPRACPNCGSTLSIGLKCCPYCGSEAERICPRCQSPIQSDWIFCPACAVQLPKSTEPISKGSRAQYATPMLSIRGTVIDGITGLPIHGAEVKIDSKTETVKVTTDPLGRFVIPGLKPRPYVLVASREGYSPQPKSFIPDAVKSEQVHFTLYPAPQSTTKIAACD